MRWPIKVLPRWLEMAAASDAAAGATEVVEPVGAVAVVAL